MLLEPCFGFFTIFLESFGLFLYFWSLFHIFVVFFGLSKFPKMIRCFENSTSNEFASAKNDLKESELTIFYLFLNR